MRLSMMDQSKIELLEHVLAGKVTIDEAAGLLDRSKRTIYTKIL